jgi:hypothetical protein
MVKKLMVLVTLVKIKMCINWADTISNNLHSMSWHLGATHKTSATKDAKFRGAKMLDIVFRKWFLVDPNFQLPSSKEEDELEENLPSDARRRNFPLDLGVQSQGALLGMEESPNSKH